MPEWERVPLGEVIRLRKEFITIDDLTTYKRCRVQVRAQGIVLRDEVAGSVIKTKKQQVCRAGEFLVAEIDAKMGGFGIVPPELEGAVVSSHYFLFEIDEAKLDRDFLDLYSKTPEFMEQVSAQGSTNYAAIRPSHVLGYTLPLPPLPEQQRIVARVKGLLAKVEEVRRLRENTLAETQNLLQSLRNEVFSQLSMTLPPRRLDEVASVQLGKMLSEKAKTGIGTTPYLRNANIKWDALDLSSIYTMDFDDRERKKFSLQYGDILMCEGGNIGQSAMWREEIPGCCYQKALHRIRRLDDTLLPEFLLQHLFWAAETGQFHDAKTQTTIAHLPAVKLKAQTVFVPDVGEQKAILQKLLSEQEKLNALRVVQNHSFTELQALPSAILAQAFAGAL